MASSRFVSAATFTHQRYMLKVEISLRPNFLTAKFPPAILLTAKTPTAKFPTPSAQIKNQLLAYTKKRIKKILKVVK